MEKVFGWVIRYVVHMLDLHDMEGVNDMVVAHLVSVLAFWLLGKKVVQNVVHVAES